MGSQYNLYCLDEEGQPMFKPDGKPDLSKGSLYVSVSNILSVQSAGEFLSRWLLQTFGREPNPIEAHQTFMENVSSLGSRLHLFFELDLKGRHEEAKRMVDEEMLPGVKSWLEFRKQHDVVLIDSEKILFSKKLGVAGTRDARLCIDGKNYIVDFKSGSIKDVGFVQLAIYHYMGRECGEVENKDYDLLILGGDKEKVSKGGAFHMHTKDSWFGKGVMTDADLFSWFMALRHIWTLQNLKSRKFQPIIKGMQEAIDPMMAKFKAKFTEPI